MTLGDLYHRDVLRLAAAATGAKRLEAPHATVERVNPVCGDKIIVDLRQDAGRITELGYAVQACVLCQASASVLGANAIGLGRGELDALRETVRRMLAESGAPPAPPFEAFATMQPASGHRSRHTCVLLPIDAVLEAMPDVGGEPKA